MMKLISWNVNGIRAIIKKNFMKFLNKENPDILCLQETKIDYAYPLLNLDYKTYWNYAEKKGYSGTCVFTKVKPLSVSYGIGKEEHDKEGRVLTLEFKDFFLVNVYVPNSKRELLRLDYREKWDNDFKEYLKELDKDKPVICCGDLNVVHKDIDIARPKSNYNKSPGYTQIEIDGFENILKSDFLDTFRLFNQEPNNYTWWSYMHNARDKNIGWRIDYFIVSERFKDKVKDASILTGVMGSDHCPISIVLS